MPLDAAIEAFFEDSELSQNFEARRGELALFSMECACARQHAGLTQKEIAEHMGTTGSAVTRLESYKPGKKPAPTLSTLQRYARALGCKLIVRLVPQEEWEDGCR